MVPPGGAAAIATIMIAIQHCQFSLGAGEEALPTETGLDATQPGADTSSARGASSDVKSIVEETKAAGATVEIREFRMKDIPVTTEDQYSCHQYDAPAGSTGDDANFAFAFEAVEEAFGGRVHHMLVFGCDGQKVSDDNFACGMSNGPCMGLPRQTFLFGWAKDAAGIALPEHSGFAVGPNSNIKTIVIQVHYANPLPDNDNSGVRMYYTTTPAQAKISHFAGVIAGVAASALVIPPQVEKTSIPVTCKWDGPEPLDVFAYRVHAHDMARGLPITWEMHRPDEHAPGEFEMVAQRDPGLAQVFNPLEKPIRIRVGDTWRLTCSYNSMDRYSVTRVGASNKMEMCNLYLMYYATHDMAWQCRDDHVMSLDPRGHRPKMVNQMGGMPLFGLRGDHTSG